MRAVHLSRWVLISLMFLAVWNVGQAQENWGMCYLSGLNYWKNVDDIQMVDNLAYITAGTSGLHIMNLDDPANPVEIGRFTLYQWGGGGDIYVLGNRAYLGNSLGGFVLDVSNPTNPGVLGQWSSTIGSGISFVHDSYAIAYTEEGYPYVLDISDPTNVHQIGEIPHSGPQEGVGMAGEYLCMTGNPGGLVLFDMSNPAKPQWVASIDTTFLTWNATISGNYGYIAANYNGLRIIDLSNPLQPVKISACDSIGWTYDVTVTDSHAVLLKGTSTEVWLDIWNVADPAHPTFEGTIPASIYGWYEIASSGNIVCSGMAGPYDAVMVVDISNPAVPVEVSSFGPKGFPTGVAIGDNIAYLSDANTKMRTVSLDVPNQVYELSHMNMSMDAGLDIAVRGNYAYLTETPDGGITIALEVFEVSNPAEPESVGYVLPAGGGTIVLDGDYGYIATLIHLYTFDLVNPAQPQLVHVLDLPLGSPGLGLAVLNGYLYWGAGVHFCVCSLSNPAEPQLVGSLNLGSNCIVDLDVSGNYAYAADGYGGMCIIDVENPASPSLVNRINGYWVRSVAATGNIAIMHDLTEISIYDVTDPLNPI